MSISYSAEQDRQVECSCEVLRSTEVFVQDRLMNARMAVMASRHSSSGTRCALLSRGGM